MMRIPRPRAEPARPPKPTEKLPKIDKLSPENVVNIKQVLQMFEEYKSREPSQVKIKLEEEASGQIEADLNDEQKLFQQKAQNIISAAKNYSDDTTMYYTCKICTNIVGNPKMCTECETTYCADCIAIWEGEGSFRKKPCPASKCRDPTYENLPRLVKSILHQIRFFCPMVGCDYHVESYLARAVKGEKLQNMELGMPYQAAIEHKQKCPYKEYPCELGCKLMVFKAHMKEHLKECINTEQVCEKCDTVFYPNRQQDSTLENHDCMKELKKRYQRNLAEEQSLLW